MLGGGLAITPRYCVPTGPSSSKALPSWALLPPADDSSACDTDWTMIGSLEYRRTVNVCALRCNCSVQTYRGESERLQWRTSPVPLACPYCGSHPMGRVFSIYLALRSKSLIGSELANCIRTPPPWEESSKSSRTVNPRSRSRAPIFNQARSYSLTDARFRQLTETPGSSPRLFRMNSSPTREWSRLMC